MGRNFVESLLTVDPEKRPNAKQALEHEWLQDIGSRRHLKLEAGVVRSLEKYSNSSRLYRAILQIMAQELEPEETRELVEIFHKLDNTNEGVIKLKDLKAAIRGTIDGSRLQTPKATSSISLSGMTSPKTPNLRLRRATSNSIDDLFHLLDSNGDEQIYYSDFLAATMDQRNKIQDASLRATFHRFDADQSGTIEVEDLKDVLGEVFEGVEVEQLIEEVASPSAGGKICYEDFLRIVQPLKSATDSPGKVLLSMTPKANLSDPDSPQLRVMLTPKFSEATPAEAPPSPFFLTLSPKTKQNERQDKGILQKDDKGILHSVAGA
jgi:calcium-dependent protein kinase